MEGKLHRTPSIAQRPNQSQPIGRGERSTKHGSCRVSAYRADQSGRSRPPMCRRDSARRGRAQPSPAARSLARTLFVSFTNTHTLSLSVACISMQSQPNENPSPPPPRDTHFPLSGGCEACISLSHAARPGRSRSRIAPFAHAVIAPLRVPLRVPAGCRERRIRVGMSHRSAVQFNLCPTTVRFVAVKP